MTVVSLVGLGKLGLPVAVALASRFRVLGYDTDPAKRSYREYEHMEKGPNGGNDFQVYFKAVCERASGMSSIYPACDGSLQLTDSLEYVVKEADIIFLAIQTPHDPELDGSKPFTQAKDFDYSYLIKAARDLAPLVRPEQTIAIISTVLPGTIRREILPILKGKCKVVYNPFFIAMGTVMHDFLNPEFVLIGEEDANGQDLVNFYFKFLGNTKCIGMSIESAELTKVAYNTFITAKIVIANTIMEIAHKTPGCNVNDVTNALGHATQRIVSNKYLTGGMGDGGACHPRDNIAMSWLATEKSLSGNLFEELMRQRDHQAHWLSILLTNKHWHSNLPIVILGKSFKPESNITAGSSAILLANMLKHRGYEFTHYDPFVDEEQIEPDFYKRFLPRVFFVATKHACFANWKFPAGSVIIDPFRYIPKQDGIEVLRIGIGEPVD